MNIVILLFCLVISVRSDLCQIAPEILCNVTFSDPRFLKTTNERVIHLGLSLKIIENDNRDFSAGFKDNIRILFGSILQLSTGATQHWIILTNKNSIQAVHRVLRNLIAKHVSENVIRGYVGTRKIRKVPKLVIDYIDLDEITRDENDKRFIGTLKSHLAQDMRGNNKYVDDLFYIGPLYHRIFPDLKKLLFLDVDLEFYRDVKLLYNQFDEFSKTNLIGVGPDLSPHYRQNLQQFRKVFPESKVGDPGPYQGFNTGVVLYELEKMRVNKDWDRILESSAVSHVMSKYGYPVSLGDQDWFTNVGFEHPDLFYSLPCQFNSQVSVQYWRPPFEDVFQDYHHCKRPFHVIHKNGCGPTKETCNEVLEKAGIEDFKILDNYTHKPKDK